MKLRAGRRQVEISNPDKVLFPDPGLTKLDLARYYEGIAPVMLPHVRGRPLALHGFPGGIEAGGYYAKNVPRHFPDWIDRVTLAKRGGEVTHVLARDAATLVYLAGQNTVTLHTWLSRADDLRRPDRMIIDLDPANGSFADVRAAARAAGELLRELGLEPHAMTTGSKGLHVTVPVRRGDDFVAVRAFAHRVGELLVEQDPKHLTMEFLKEKRGGRIYVDVNRNQYAQHAVAPYSVRPGPGAPVAAPLYWEELSERRTTPRRWTIRNVLDRVREDGDPWRGIGSRARGLGRPRRRLERL